MNFDKYDLHDLICHAVSLGAQQVYRSQGERSRYAQQRHEVIRRFAKITKQTQKVAEAELVNASVID